MQNSLNNKTIEKLKYDLVREGFLDYESLSKAEELSKKDNTNLAQVLIKQNFISEQDLLGFIEAKLHIPFVNLENYSLDKECLKFISKQEATKFRIIPLFKIEDILTIAMADPLDLFLLNNLVNRINCKIEPIVCSERSILDVIEDCYPQNIPENDAFNDVLEKEIGFDWREELNSENHDDLQAQRIIQAIIKQAIIENSQEIILENQSDGVSVKYKKNREAFDKGFIPVLLVPLCISNLKIMAGLDPATSESPQLGKLKISHESKTVSVGVATFPTVKGERIQLKIYELPGNLDELFENNEDLKLITENLNNPGLVMVGGSESFDKTSVIYSILSSIDAKTRNIMTVESLVKYEISDINQCELNEKVGFNIDRAIKLIEFHSPDVIYIENALTKSGIEAIEYFVQSGKLIITEFNSDNIEKTMSRLESDFKNITNLISIMIFLEDQDKIRVLNISKSLLTD
jgi:type IV pilus assembly protein PilB